MSEFLRIYTAVGVQADGGFRNREGIGSVLRRPVDGRTAYEVCFKYDSSSELRAALVHEIKESRGVEEVRKVVVDPSTGEPL